MLRQVQLDLRRPLRAVEKNQLAWPKMCAVCFVYDPAKLDNCKFCNAAWFCHNEHRDNQVIAVHPPGLCIQLRLYYSMVIVGKFLLVKYFFKFLLSKFKFRLVFDVKHIKRGFVVDVYALTLIYDVNF